MVWKWQAAEAFPFWKNLWTDSVALLYGVWTPIYWRNLRDEEIEKFEA